MKQQLLSVFEEKNGFILIGLTGRTGSGCSTTAKLMTSEIFPDVDRLDRRDTIIKTFLKSWWKPFFCISASDVIMSFLSGHSRDVIEVFLNQWINNKQDVEDVTDLIFNTPTIDFESVVNLNEYSDLKNKIKERIDSASYTAIFQALGTNIRKNGTPFYKSKNYSDSPWVFSERINKIIKSIKKNTRGATSRFVIDAIRNPFEAVYFKDRYANFYLVAINTPDSIRATRLNADLIASQISKIDAIEYPNKSNPLSGIDIFYSQNIQKCIESSDIHILNNHEDYSKDDEHPKALCVSIARYVALMIHPGLVTPTKEERCMHIAFSQKLNSGCISRQVGAVITDDNYSVKAVGWNDVPRGQISCIDRNLNDLIHARDKDAFSEYEFHRKGDFIKEIGKKYKKIKLRDINKIEGRSISFCFKDNYNTLIDKGNKNQVHTRALHAEENAFLQLAKYGGQAIEGGFLFTSASPCELCSKKAYQLGLKKIFYIDPYPGIAEKQILLSGSIGARPELVLFSGAVGTTYHKLYTPVFPIKDEIEILVDDFSKDDEPPKQVDIFES